MSDYNFIRAESLPELSDTGITLTGDSSIDMSYFKQGRTDRSRHMASKDRTGMTDLEKKLSRGMLTSIWGLKSQAKDSQESVAFLRANGVDEKVIAFYETVYSSLTANTPLDLEKYKAIFRDPNRSYDSFIIENKTLLTYLYNQRVGNNVSIDKSGRIRDEKGLFVKKINSDVTDDELKEWLFNEGYIHVAIDNTKKKLQFIIDAVRECTTPEQIEERFSPQKGNWFVANNVFGVDGTLTPDFVGLANNKLFYAYEKTFIAGPETKKEGNKRTFTKEFAVVKQDSLTVAYPRGRTYKNAVILDETLTRKELIGLSRAEFEKLEKEGRIVGINDSSFRIFNSALKGDTYCVINKHSGAIESYNIQGAELAKSIAEATYHTYLRDKLDYQEKSNLDTIKRTGIAFRPVVQGVQKDVLANIAENKERDGIKVVETRTSDISEQLGIKAVVRGVSTHGMDNLTKGDTSEAQFVYNFAYDALRDLSMVLGVESKNFYDGMILGYGANGKPRTLAHFQEQPDGHYVNLNRMAGIGSLSHEIWHMKSSGFAHALSPAALSDSNDAMSILKGISTMGNNSNITRLPDFIMSQYPAMKELVDFVKDKSTDFYKVSALADKYKTKKYWSDPEEMLARAFNYYVAKKLNDFGIENYGVPFNNDFLTGAIHNSVSNAFSVEKSIMPRGDDADRLVMLFDSFISEMKDVGMLIAVDKPVLTNIDELRTRIESDFPEGRVINVEVPLSSGTHFRPVVAKIDRNSVSAEELASKVSIVPVVDRSNVTVIADDILSPIIQVRQVTDIKDTLVSRSEAVFEETYRLHDDNKEKVHRDQGLIRTTAASYLSPIDCSAYRKGSIGIKKSEGKQLSIDISFGDESGNGSKKKDILDRNPEATSKAIRINI